MLNAIPNLQLNMQASVTGQRNIAVSDMGVKAHQHKKAISRRKGYKRIRL